MLKEPVSVVMPVCNEFDVIPLVVSEWLEVMELLPKGSTLEFDDGDSTDGTKEYLKTLQDKYEFVKVNFAQRDGFSKAVERLLTNAKNRWVFVADSDGQYSASDILYFIANYEEGCSFIKGVKINRKDGLPRRFFSFLMNRSINVLLGLPFLDYNSSHYLINRDDLLRLTKSGFQFRNSINVEITLLMILNNLRYDIVYVRHSKRAIGVSRGNPPLKFLNYGIRTMIDVYKLKQNF